MNFYKTAKPKTCPCGTKFTPQRSMQKYHSPQCEMSHKTGRAVTDLSTLSLSVLMSMAKGTFQAWIKKRDEGKPCVSCDKVFKKGDVIHASHFFKVEVFAWLMFDEDNAHRSCDHCNVGLDGNIPEYAKRIAGRIGRIAFSELSRKAMRKVYYKPSKHELIEIIEKYKA